MSRAARPTAAAHADTDHVPELDWLMLAVLGLTTIGLLMGLSIEGGYRGVEPVEALKGHGGKLLLGLMAFLFCAACPMGLIRKLAPAVFWIGVALCVVARFVGESKGAGRWIPISGSLTFQPVELARVAMVVLLADRLVRVGEGVATLGGLVRVFWRVGCLVGALLIQPDNGNAMFCLAIACAMTLVGGARMRWFILAGLPVVALVAMKVASHGYVQSRFDNFPDTQVGTQVGQAQVALAVGEVAGVGLGNGRLKAGYVAEARNDFVFAVVGEELGFLGTMLVVAGFTIIGAVGYRLVRRTHDPFLRYVILGSVLIVCIQASINLLVATGLAPAKGIDLPFISSGGTSLLFCFAAVGLMGNAARTDRRTPGA